LQYLQPRVGDGWIHASLILPPAPRASLLIVPPFFHEWQRGYRLFALLADALSKEGIAVMRFDYRGCGDSSGEDADFLPSQALADTSVALETLAAATQHRPVLMGVRAGGLIAEAVAGSSGHPFAFWQPVQTGIEYLKELRHMDRTQRNSRTRFPYLKTERPDDAGSLMGHRLHPDFDTELSVFRRSAAPLFVVAPQEAAGSDPSILIEGPLSDWAKQVDMESLAPRQALQHVARELSERLSA
jgi:hypothetical protein